MNKITDKLTKCNYCDKPLVKGDKTFKTLNNGVICDDCCKSRFSKCNQCGEYTHNNNIMIAYDEYYCRDCFDELFFNCEQCGEIYFRDDELNVTHDGAYYCNCCFEDRENNENEDDMIEIVKKPSKTFKKNKDKRYVGVEFEVEGGYFNRITFSDKIKNHICVSRDGSLEDGCEVKSLPMNGDLLFEQITRICTEIQDKGGHITKRCGLHVHFDVSDFDKNELKKLFFVYRLYQEHFFSIVSSSRRDNSYCERLRGSKERLDECLDAPTFEHFWHSIDWKQTKGLDCYRNSSRYFWCNLNSAFLKRNTVEIRLHQGSLDDKKILNWIRIHLKLIDWCKNADIKRVISLKSGMSNFLNIIHNNDLKAYIRMRRKKFKYAKPRKIVNTKELLTNIAITKETQNKRVNPISAFFDDTWKSFDYLMPMVKNYQYLRNKESKSIRSNLKRLNHWLYPRKYYSFEKGEKVSEKIKSKRRVEFYKRYKTIIETVIEDILSKHGIFKRNELIVIIRNNKKKITDIQIETNLILLPIWKKIFRRYRYNVRNTIFNEVEKEIKR